MEAMPLKRRKTQASKGSEQTVEPSKDVANDGEPTNA